MVIPRAVGLVIYPDASSHRPPFVLSEQNGSLLRSFRRSLDGKSERVVTDEGTVDHEVPSVEQLVEVAQAGEVGRTRLVPLSQSFI